MPKTLLQINTVVNSGSTGRIAEEIGQTALAAGWRSVIAFGRNPLIPLRVRMAFERI